MNSYGNLLDPVLTLTDAPDDAARAVVNDGLNGFNDEVTGYDDRRRLAVLVKDPYSGNVIGGMTGRTSLGLLFIDVVYLPAALRGRNIGTRMLEMAEMEARRRGCRAGVLFTISFQAPGFYARLGWRVFGDIPCDPPGTSRVFMTKEFR